MKQDRTRLDQVLKGVSRDYKKRMNQIMNETNKWKKKAEKLRESKETEVINHIKGRWGCVPPLDPFYFQFHAIFRNKWPK